MNILTEASHWPVAMMQDSLPAPTLPPNLSPPPIETCWSALFLPFLPPSLPSLTHIPSSVSPSVKPLLLISSLIRLRSQYCFPFMPYPLLPPPLSLHRAVTFCHSTQPLSPPRYPHAVTLTVEWLLTVQCEVGYLAWGRGVVVGLGSPLTSG